MVCDNWMLCAYLLYGVCVAVVDCAQGGSYLRGRSEIWTVGQSHAERVEAGEELLLSVLVCSL